MRSSRAGLSVQPAIDDFAGQMLADMGVSPSFSGIPSRATTQQFVNETDGLGKAFSP